MSAHGYMVALPCPYAFIAKDYTRRQSVNRTTHNNPWLEKPDGAAKRPATDMM